MNEFKPLVGVATLVIRDGKILIGKDERKGALVCGVPGGHWENGESIKECAIREVKEESGIVCDNIELISVYDFYREDKQRSYVTIGMKAEFVSGNPTDKEDEGRLGWDWYSVEDSLKLNLFPADRVLINRYLSGEIFK